VQRFDAGLLVIRPEPAEHGRQARLRFAEVALAHAGSVNAVAGQTAPVFRPGRSVPAIPVT
jgi:hypothetical protein